MSRLINLTLLTSGIATTVLVLGLSYLDTQQHQRNAYLAQQHYLNVIHPFVRTLPRSTEVIYVVDFIDKSEGLQLLKIVTKSMSPILMRKKTQDQIEISGLFIEPSDNYDFIYAPDTDFGDSLPNSQTTDNYYSWDNRRNKTTHWRVSFLNTTTGFYAEWERIIVLK